MLGKWANPLDALMAIDDMDVFEYDWQCDNVHQYGPDWSQCVPLLREAALSSGRSTEARVFARDCIASIEGRQSVVVTEIDGAFAASPSMLLRLVASLRRKGFGG